MSDSPVVPRDDAPALVSIPEMPDRLEAAGLRRVGAARIRQLVKEPDFPDPVYTRNRLWLWEAVEQFFRDRKLSSGERTDLKKTKAEGRTSATDEGGEKRAAVQRTAPPIDWDDEGAVCCMPFQSRGMRRTHVVINIIKVITRTAMTCECACHA